MPAFIIYMAGAAGIGLFKVLLVAGILPKEMFGNYVTLASGAMLLTMVMSAGLIEGTIKRFPRLWAENNAGQIVTDVRSILVKVVLRTTIISAGAVICTLASGRVDLLIFILPGIFLGGAGLVVRLLSSAQLAIGSTDLLINFSIFRALITFVLVVVGAWGFGFFGAVFGEAAAVIAVILQAWLGLKRFLTWNESTSEISPFDHPDYRLYIGSVMTSGTMLADRPLVNLLSGSALAGSYGFAMITAQISQMLVNIIAQRLGPIFIKAKHQGGHENYVFNLLIKVTIFSISFSLLITLCGIMLFQLSYFEPIFEKYSISKASIILIGLICALYIFVLFEYVLIAADSEGTVMYASILAMIAFLLCFSIARYYGGSLELYLIAALLTRAFQTILLGAEIVKPGWYRARFDRTIQ